MTHVFIVNKDTFDIHLSHLFVGTGFADNYPDLDSKDEKKYLHEDNFSDLIADISKVRAGDSVLFYNTECKKFFGVFEIVGKPFYDSQDKRYLFTDLNQGELNKKNKNENYETHFKALPFRVRIRPRTVYFKGVSETVALDDISQISKPYEMCWSMIYRKLTGERGCTYLSDYEAERLITLIKNENSNQALTNGCFGYDLNDKCIVNRNNSQDYEGDTDKYLDIKNRLLHIKNQAHEHLLQAYIMQNYDSDNDLKKLLPKEYNNIWVGNEVVCSVGEKRIDVLFIATTDKTIIIRVIELKSTYPKKDIIKKQLPWYLKWIGQYIVPNLKFKGKSIKIIPTIIAYNYMRECNGKEDFKKEVKNFNSNKPVIRKAKICNIEFFKIMRTTEDIKFKKESIH